MTQSIKGSFVESCCNTASGMVISYLMALVVYPLFGHAFSLRENVAITGIFTVVSIARSFVWRRVFVQLFRG